MLKRAIPLLLSAALLGGAVATVPAITANAAPHSVTGYHAEGTIRVQGENQCFTALNLGNGVYALSLQQCVGDPDQIWESIVVYGVLKVSLLGHPNIVLSGLPGPHNYVELLNTINFVDHIIPFNRSTYISGSLKPGGKTVNKISNIYRNRIYAPKRGRTMGWTGFFFPLSANRGLIFGGTGWIAETEL